ncbi:related to heterokaryon incompatibility protein het-6 [Fusarium mangiferae]|uniref:Related to heterokaryon incompatibility protein het-6 n=1 Tax=Fusarium mangiferae TaxID=192010 RepID=A0A1L7TSQ3_FUSMA|nr:uncharacterized protein FMAN_08500 [Fusarium mangiferae]CVK98685.1 related to heterokaryon incompatibility protein het-6 [Fusarium mangiferae]
MDQQEQSCKRHDFMLLPASDAFMRTCLSCGLVEDVELSQQKQQVDPWAGWLRAEIQPLSWPHCVQYSETSEATLVKAATGDKEFYSYRPNVQTSFQSSAQRERNPYVYSDLPKGSWIRLLELSPGSRLDTLSGRIFQVSWEQETCPLYLALSYTWADDRGDASPSNLIFLDKEQKVMRITRNCDRALRSLRQEYHSVLLWVDSICINQLSPSERSHQVGLMKTIYSKATAVHAYVGEMECGDDSTGTEAMDLLHDIQVNGICDVLSRRKTSTISSLNKFFGRPYFARLWVVQELLLAQSITIHCGEVSLHVTNESMSSNTEQAPLDLRGLLAATSICRVTDLRDKIFGLLGLISNDQASELSPDYELTVREVYTGVAAYLMQKSHCCDIIQHANPYWARNWFVKDHQYCNSDYGIPSWVPFWDTDVPVHASEDIYRQVEQIELDSKCLLKRQALFDRCTIRIIDGWPHDGNSVCDRGAKSCKMVDAKSGFLATRIETVLRLDYSLESVLTVRWELDQWADGEYFTGFWNLKDGVKLAIRSLAWALKCTVSNADVYLIRVEGCTALFLAQPTSDIRKYRLIGSCVAAIVCPTPEPSPTGILKSDDLHRYLEFEPLTVEMIHFISKWRNQVFELTRSDPEDAGHVASIQGQSCSYAREDKPETMHPSWRSWIPFLALGARNMLEGDSELQKQLPNLVNFWDKAYALHTTVQEWTKSALQVSDHVRIQWYKFSQDVKNGLEDLMEKSRELGGVFGTITGSRPILQSLHHLQALLDQLANGEVRWAEDDLSIYPGELERFFKDYDRLLIALKEDQLILDKAFPLDLKDVHPKFSSIKETIKWKPMLEGLVRENAEHKEIHFI